MRFYIILIFLATSDGHCADQTRLNTIRLTDGREIVAHYIAADSRIILASSEGFTSRRIDPEEIESITEWTELQEAEHYMRQRTAEDHIRSLQPGFEKDRQTAITQAVTKRQFDARLAESMAEQARAENAERQRQYAIAVEAARVEFDRRQKEILTQAQIDAADAQFIAAREQYIRAAVPPIVVLAPASPARWQKVHTALGSYWQQIP